MAKQKANVKTADKESKSAQQALGMQYRAKHRFARISARKVRLVADLVRGKFVEDALDILRYQPQRGARMIEKVLRSAMGNAQDPDHGPNQKRGQTASPDALVVADLRVDGGPMFKRVRPRARGMAFFVLRRFSHISVVLEEVV